MARQEIKLGELVKSAWKKVNDNFTELYANKVDAVEGKGLSTNDYTDEEKQKVSSSVTITKHDFTASEWVTHESGTPTLTIAAAGKYPVKVMKQNGDNYDEVIVQSSVSGTNVVLEADETFSGHVILV